MNRKNQTVNYKIAMTGVFGALSLLLILTNIGYVSLGTLISITIMHIPTILATLLAGLVPGLGVGLIFGISSLVHAAMNPVGMNVFFLNPCVSIVPRLIIPVTTWLCARALGAIPRMPKTVSGGMAAAVGTLTNTVLVMGAIYLFYGERLLSGMGEALSRLGFAVQGLGGIRGYGAILACTFASNGIWEVVGAVIITAAVLGGVYLMRGRRAKIRREERE